MAGDAPVRQIAGGEQPVDDDAGAAQGRGRQPDAPPGVAGAAEIDADEEIERAHRSSARAWLRSAKAYPTVSRRIAERSPGQRRRWVASSSEEPTSALKSLMRISY